MKAYERVAGSQTQEPYMEPTMDTPRLWQLLDVMEDKKPTQLCTPFRVVVDQHLSCMLAAIYPRVNCEVLLANDLQNSRSICILVKGGYHLGHET